MKKDLAHVLKALASEGAELPHLARALGVEVENLRHRLVSEGLTLEIERRIGEVAPRVLDAIFIIRAGGEP